LLARAHAAGVDMPITEAVTQLLTGRDMAATLTVLMGRALRDE
jgi:glycerol-3-phosphate dehydrogenase